MIIAISEIISYLESPGSYKLGSEAMVSNGGYKYKSTLTFLLFQIVQIIFSMSAIFLLYKAKNAKLLLLAILIVISSIAGYFIF